MFEMIKYTKNKITSKYYKIKTLLSILDRVNIVVNNDNIILSIDSNMVINQTGNMMIYSKDGCLVTSHKKTHINPEIKIVSNDTNETIHKAEVKEQLLSKRDLFVKLLKQKRIHTV